MQCMQCELRTDVMWQLQVAIPREQIYAIKEGLPVNEAACEYAGQLLRLDASILPRNAEGMPMLSCLAFCQAIFRVPFKNSSHCRTPHENACVSHLV